MSAVTDQAAKLVQQQITSAAEKIGLKGILGASLVGAITLDVTQRVMNHAGDILMLPVKAVAYPFKAWREHKKAKVEKSRLDVLEGEVVKLRHELLNVRSENLLAKPEVRKPDKPSNLKKSNPVSTSVKTLAI